MKKIIYMLLTLVLFISFAYSQERDSLIQLYPGIGDTLRRQERDTFNLLPYIKGFDYAIFYIREKKLLISDVTYQINGDSRDTTIKEGLYRLGILRKEIAQNRMLHSEENNKPQWVTILSLTGNKYQGNLEMYNENYLYLNTPYQFSYYKISSSSVESISISGESKILPALGVGISIGFIIGTIIGYEVV